MNRRVALEREKTFSSLCFTLGRLLALSVLLVAGCSDTSTASWRIHFPSDGGIDDVARMRLRVLSGDCSATAVVYRADVSRMDAVPEFGEIGEGDFAFEALALDSSCAVVARGCTPTSLPLVPGEVLVTQLAPVVREAPLCAVSSCLDGYCRPDLPP